jgi:hypothetical protein
LCSMIEIGFVLFVRGATQADSTLANEWPKS